MKRNTRNVTQLIALENRRTTGTSEPLAQIAEFERLGIPTRPSNPTGRLIIECVAYTHEVRPCFTALQWSVICDENVGTGFIRQNRTQVTSERSEQHQENLHQHDAGATQLLRSSDAAGKEAHQRRIA